VSLVVAAFGSGEAAFEPFDLAVVVGFVFADVEPLAVVVGRSPGPVFVDGEEPVIVALFETGEGVAADFGEGVEVEVEGVSFDAFAACVAELAGGGESFLIGFGPVAPFAAVECVELVEAFCGGEVEEHGADGVGFVVDEEIQLFYGHAFYGHQDHFAHPAKHGDHCSYLG